MLWRVLLALAVPLVVLGRPAPGAAQEDQAGPVYLVDVSGTIDLGLAPYLDRVLAEAEDDGASAVIVEIDTPGGRLDAVLQMRDALLNSPLTTVALVDSSAFSAGALVAIACTEITMTPGSVMGAATPVGGTGEAADAKTISAVRSTFEATAEERGRDPQVAGAMVDPDVEVEGLTERGSLLTLTASQATEVGYADGVVADRAALLADLGLADREQIETSPSLVERLVRVLTSPVVATLLLTVGMLALISDLVTGGGVGLGAAVGLGLLALFFWGHMLAGLAGWEDVALVALGLGLIAVEVFVVPGFGVPGILGLVALLGGAFLAMINRDFDFVTNAAIVRAAVAVTVTFVAIILGLFVVLTVVSRRRPGDGAGGGLVLHTVLGGGEPVTERAQGGWLRWFGATARLPSERSTVNDTDADTDTAADPAGDGEPSLLGATGTALSDLRPSGVADIDGERVDVVTVGDYLRSGEPIEVIRDDRYRRVVRRRRP